jgi:peptidoglycan/LPS O-acetylase OafA/YrhL
VERLAELHPEGVRAPLSGFLVAGSLERNRLHHFLLLRGLRIVPALAFEVVVSACLIGLVFTALSPARYVASPEFRLYFLNIVGLIHVTLPQVFPGNPLPDLMNPQLWTIPFELECYLAISVLAVLGFVWHRYYLALAVFAFIVLGTVYTLWKPNFSAHSAIEGHIPGKILVLVFLTGVMLYRHRAHIPYNNWLGLGSLIAMAIVFRFPTLYFFSVLPVAYFAVWIGLKQPPTIPFGDLSYGVFLFHFPITQMVMALAGKTILGSWWVFGPLSLVASALCAAVSWTFIEKPLLANKRAILGWADNTWARLRAPALRPVAASSGDQDAPPSAKG